MTLESENVTFSKQAFDMKKKHDESAAKSKEAFELLETLKGKYDLVKDLNLMYRRFYSRNVID